MNDSQRNQIWYEQFIATCPPQERENLYGDVAQLYDRVRPRYPKNLIDRAVSQLPADATLLEIGCGPGTATVEFARLGYTLTALEPSLQACHLARHNCRTYTNVEVLNTTLENWELQARYYDAVIAATSLHWVSPEVGYPKIAAALKENGLLILLWNSEVQPHDEIYQQMRPVYLAQEPAIARFHDEHRHNRAEDLAQFGQRVIDSGLFEMLFSEHIECDVTYCIEDYLALLRTYSPYIRLEADKREDLLANLFNVLKNFNSRDIPSSSLAAIQVLKLKNS